MCITIDDKPKRAEDRESVPGCNKKGEMMMIVYCSFFCFLQYNCKLYRENRWIEKTMTTTGTKMTKVQNPSSPNLCPTGPNTSASTASSSTSQVAPPSPRLLVWSCPQSGQAAQNQSQNRPEQPRVGLLVDRLARHPRNPHEDGTPSENQSLSRHVHPC